MSVTPVKMLKLFMAGVFLTPVPTRSGLRSDGGDEDRARCGHDPHALEVRYSLCKMPVRNRMRDVGLHLRGGELERRFEIDPPYLREVRPQELLTGLPHEETPAVGKVAPGELPKLRELPDAVRRRYKPAAGRQDACELGKSLVEVRHVIEHEVRDCGVEHACGEGELLDVADACID